MSVNRKPDLDTSLSRMDGTRSTYLKLSWADRYKTADTANAELSFDSQSNVIGNNFVNFEIPQCVAGCPMIPNLAR